MQSRETRSPGNHRTKHLQQLLDGYRSADEREDGYLERMKSLLSQSASPFCRDNYQPGHFTASSFVLSPDGTELLLIYHSKLHRWLQPGGHFEAEDSDAAAAARREVQEEVGLVDLKSLSGPLVLTPACKPSDAAALFDLDIHPIPERGNSPPHEHFDLRFLWKAPHREATAGSDALKCRWVPLTKVPSIESDESVTRAVSKIQQLPWGRG